MAHPKGYSSVQIGLHWLIAISIIAAFFTHEVMHDRFDERLASGITPGPSDGTWHTILGGLAFALVIVRVIVRWRRGAPPAPEETSPQLARAIHWGHMLIYALIIGVPLGGMAAWFGGIEIAGGVHGIVGKLLMLVVLGHAGMAIFHQVALKDGTLMRMLRPGR